MKKDITGTENIIEILKCSNSIGFNSTFTSIRYERTDGERKIDCYKSIEKQL